MKNCEFFLKKFSVGLTLDASVSNFEDFLSKYSKYISNFYFSLPLGDKFHARENVVKQMHDPYKVELFWKMLKMIKSYGIKLELVLNNGNVTESDIIRSKQLLDENGITIDLLGITDDIYADVKKYFPNQELVYSFKNRSHTKEDFKNASGHYDEIVLGRQNIRNYDLFDYIKNQLNAKVVLLINNGCSHICGGCTTLENCHSSYYRAKLNYSSEVLYALQSIMPYEIHENLLDLTNVDLLKISSRNASLQYLYDCINSYINCIEDTYIEQSNDNYLLWGRLAWHAEYYDDFSLQRIRDYKGVIYSKGNFSVLNNKIKLCLDYRDKYLFDDTGFVYDEERINYAITKELRGLPYSIDECIIGVSNCRNLFTRVSLEKLQLLIQKLELVFDRICFEIPPLLPEDYVLLERLLKNVSNRKIHCIVVNDWDLAQYITNNYSIPIAIGEKLSFSNIYSPANDYMCDNNKHFGVNLISNELRNKILQMEEVKFVVCDMNPDGVCISKSEKLPLYINLLHRSIVYDTCNRNREPVCTMDCQCTEKNFLRHQEIEKFWSLYCNSIREHITDFRPIVKTVFENRATFIIKV